MTREEYEHEILHWQREAYKYKALYFESLHELRKANKGIGRLVRGKVAHRETVELLKEGILHPTKANGNEALARRRWAFPNGKELTE